MHIYKSIPLGVFSFKTLMTTLQNMGCHFVSCFYSTYCKMDFGSGLWLLNFINDSDMSMTVILAIIHILFFWFVSFLKIPVTETLERILQLQHGQTYSCACLFIDGFVEQLLSFDCADSRLTPIWTFHMQSDSFVNNTFHHVSVLESC